MNILFFGDEYGVKQAFRFIPSKWFCGIVMASNRPQYHKKIKIFAGKKKIKLLLQPLRTSNAYKKFFLDVKKIKPDLLLVHSYSMIIKNDILKIPRLGGLNIHASLLPKYRGCNPIEWAIINNEKKTGVTLHKLTAKLDSGEILSQLNTSIKISETWKDINQKIIVLTEKILKKAARLIEQKKLNGVAQERKKATYYPRRKPSDAEINWSWSALKIYNFIRAQVPPHHSAWCRRKNGDIKYFKKIVPIKKIKKIKKYFT